MSLQAHITAQLLKSTEYVFKNNFLVILVFVVPYE